MHFSLAELADRVGGRVEGDGSLRIERVMPLEEAGPHDVSFFANRKYAKDFAATRAGATPRFHSTRPPRPNATANTGTSPLATIAHSTAITAASNHRTFAGGFMSASRGASVASGEEVAVMNGTRACDAGGLAPTPAGRRVLHARLGAGAE